MSDLSLFAPLAALDDFDEKASRMLEEVWEQYRDQSGAFYWFEPAGLDLTLFDLTCIEVMEALESCGMEHRAVYSLLNDGPADVVLILMQADPELRQAMEMAAESVVEVIVNQSVADAIRNGEFYA